MTANQNAALEAAKIMVYLDMEDDACAAAIANQFGVTFDEATQVVAGAKRMRQEVDIADAHNDIANRND